MMSEIHHAVRPDGRTANLLTSSVLISPTISHDPSPLMDAATCNDNLPILLERARSLGFTFSHSRAAQFVQYCELVMAANTEFNLTAHRTPEAIMMGLLLDSLALDALLPRATRSTRSLRLVDVGSGAGVPGIPLKILHPGWNLVLVESVKKKARFLEKTTDTMGLNSVTVLNRRAEELGVDREWRDNANLVVARAVAPLPSLLELSAPMAEPGGLLAFPKGAGADEEVRQSTSAARALRLEHEETRPVPAGLGIGEKKVVVIYRKLRPTPSGYPRRIGLALSRPIRFTG